MLLAMISPSRKRASHFQAVLFENLKLIFYNSNHMLQEKIVDHMLDHTCSIRIESVPIDLKET